MIIASAHRAEQLEQTVTSVLRQSCLPEEILVCVSDRNHVTASTFQYDKVTVLVGPKGSCHQRNTGLSNVSPGTDYVFFFDDDIELSLSYIEMTVALMERHRNVTVAVGAMLLDAANGQPVNRAEAVRLCRESDRTFSSPDTRLTFSPRTSGSACAMAVRWSAAAQERFDENLPLYGWLEDLDYSYRVGAHGLVVQCHNSHAVHLGWRGGRVSGRALGYSQIVNPLYLWKKNRCLPLLKVLYRHWLWHFAANVSGVLSRDRDVDRLGRLVGNFRGLKSLLLGRLDPSSLPSN